MPITNVGVKLEAFGSLPHQDLGPAAKLPRWCEHLVPAPPIGSLTRAPLPARRGVLRKLLDLLLATDQAFARQVC